MTDFPKQEILLKNRYVCTFLAIDFSLPFDLNQKDVNSIKYLQIKEYLLVSIWVTDNLIHRINHQLHFKTFDFINAIVFVRLKTS